LSLALDRLDLGFQKQFKEDFAMSETHKEPWLDTWWPALVIAFGLIFVSCLVFFKPLA
jgi:hypothetical protein